MSNNEREVLLKIFPTEIWEQILEHVKEPEDYHNLCNASPYFRDLLLPRAPEILFPQVVKPILHQVQREEINGRYKYKPNALLRCYAAPFRLVCRSWRQGVDQVLQTQHLYPNIPKDHEEFDGVFGPCQHRNFDRFSDSEDFNAFNRHFESTHEETIANPFVCRAVEFYVSLGEPEIHFGDTDEEEEDIEEVRENVDELVDYFRPCSQFLRKYGHHIWSCVINVRVGELFHQEILQIYEWLRVILEQMPNLQFLEVYISGIWVHLDELDDVMPFPTLPQLRFLLVCGDLFSNRRSDDEWVWKLLLANPQVEMVNARSDCWSAGTVEHLLEHATNLKAVALQPVGGWDLDRFCNARVVNAPVENLWLDTRKAFCPFGFPYVSQPQAWSQWQRIFTAIQSHFSASLKQLRLRLPKLLVGKFDGALVLPQLKILQLDLEELVPLDFLLPLKDTLEQLSLRTSSRSTDKLDQADMSTLKLYKFWETPEMSNAWVLFPKLKLLRTGKGTLEEDDGRWFCANRDQWRNAETTLQMHLLKIEN